MSNWTIITADHLKAAGYGTIVDAAASKSIGSVDPVAEAIAGAVARVRRAVAAGNSLDTDPAKVPGSLRAVTIRIALYALMERIGLALDDDQKDTRRNDNSDLNRVHDSKQRVEIPDNPEADGTSFAREPSPSVRHKDRKFTERTMDGI